MKFCVLFLIFVCLDNKTQCSVCTPKFSRISRFKMVTNKFDVIFTPPPPKKKCRSVQSSLSFAKVFSYEREACQCINKVYCIAIYKKNNTCTCCVFNGFKNSNGKMTITSRKRLRAKNTPDLHLTYSNTRGSVGFK